MTDLTPGALIAHYIKLRDRRSAMAEEFKQADKPYKDAMSSIENALLAEMNKLGVDNLKNKEFGTAFKKKSMFVRTIDKDDLMKYVVQSQDFDMLTAAVSKEAVKKYLEEHGDECPPGVSVTFETEVQIRKPS